MIDTPWVCEAWVGGTSLRLRLRCVPPIIPYLYIEKGCCYDNAVCERFFWSLKHEWANHRSYFDRADARSSVFHYIELFDNRTRLHQALGYLSPEAFEAEHAPASKVA